MHQIKLVSEGDLLILPVKMKLIFILIAQIHETVGIRFLRLVLINQRLLLPETLDHLSLSHKAAGTPLDHLVLLVVVHVQLRFAQVQILHLSLLMIHEAFVVQQIFLVEQVYSCV